MRAFLAIFILTTGMLLGFDYVVKPWIAPSRPQPIAVAIPEPVKPVTGTRVVSPVVTVATTVSAVETNTSVVPPRTEPVAAPTTASITVVAPAASPSVGHAGLNAPPALPAPLVFRAAVEAETATADGAVAASETTEDAKPRTPPRHLRRLVKPVRTADQSRKKVQELFTNPLGRY